MLTETTKVGRLEVVAPPEWIALVKTAAEAAGRLSISAYVRMAVSEKMRQNGFLPPPAKVRAAHRPKREGK